MDKYTFKKTNAIVSEFNFQELTFNVIQHKDLEVIDLEAICIRFLLNNGPIVEIRFMCDDSDYNIPVRSVLLHKIPKDRKSQVLEVCNTLHSLFNNFIFYIDEDDNDLVFKYDRECRIPIEYSAGEIAFEMYGLLTVILNCIWPMFAQAVYSTNEDSEECLDLSNSLFKHLKRPGAGSKNTVSKSSKKPQTKKTGNHKKDNKPNMTLLEKYLNREEEEHDSDDDDEFL